MARDMVNAADKDLLQPANTGHILQQQQPLPAQPEVIFRLLGARMEMTAGHEEFLANPTRLQIGNPHVEIPLAAMAGQHGDPIEPCLGRQRRRGVRVSKQALQVGQGGALFHQLGTAELAGRKIDNGGDHGRHHLLLNIGLSAGASAPFGVPR